jgi:hypothetical protein
MPIGEYFGGEGEKVMRSMRSTYKSPKKAKQVFYALANKEGETPAKDTPDFQHNVESNLFRDRMHAAVDRLFDRAADRRALDSLRRIAKR